MASERIRYVILTIVILTAIAAAVTFYVLADDGPCQASLEDCAIDREQRGG